MKTKNSSVEEGGSAEKDMPPRKKLKQARLPFQILPSEVGSSSPPAIKNNKRKHESPDDIKIVKIIKPDNKLCEAKENVNLPVLSSDLKKSLDGASKTSMGASKKCETVVSESKLNNSKHEGKLAQKNSEIEAITISDNDDSLLENSLCNSDSSPNERKKTADETDENSLNVFLTKSKSRDGTPVCNDATENKKTETPDKHTEKESPHSKPEFKKDIEKNISESKSSDNSTQVHPQNKHNEIDEELIEESKQSENSDKSDDSQTPNLKSPYSNKLSKKEEETKNTDEGCKKSASIENLVDSGVDNCADTSVNGLKTPNQKSPQSTTNKGSEEDSFAESSPKDVCTEDNLKAKDSTPKVSPNSVLSPAQNVRKLTPKQLQKQLDSAKKREEKEKQRQEREKKKAEEREEKLRQKQEKEDQKKKEKEEREEQKRKEKEEKEEQKKKEKEEKEEQKRKEREEKEEQKRKEKEEKEELRRKEKEEKEKKKQLELELKNEEKRKMQAEAAAFTSFFKKADLKQPDEPKANVEEKFMPFEVKADMKLAPHTRVNLNIQLKQTLDEALLTQNKEKLYLDQIKNKDIIPKKGSPTWRLSDFKDEVVIIEEDEIPSGVANSLVESYPADCQMPRPKLLQFWENRRPPYWGTWRKKSSSIAPTKPFSKDEKYFDYELDSDDEWEEEEPGESLHGSDDEKESEDEYEVDNEFFVPHGYLSEEENEGDDEVESPEKMKNKLKLLELEFEEEMKHKMERLKPRVIGCIWIDPKKTDAVGEQLLKLLGPFQAVCESTPIVCAPPADKLSGSPDVKSNASSPTTSLKKIKKFPPEGIPALITLIHGNINKREFLVREFLAYWNKEQQKLLEKNLTTSDSATLVSSPAPLVKRSISNKIKELATWISAPDEGPMNGRMCWYVSSEVRENFGLSDLTIPNNLWTYTIKPKRRENDTQMPSSSTTLNGEVTPKQLITKFTKVLTEEDRKKQFSPTTSEGTEGNSGETRSQTEKTQRKLQFNSASKGSNGVQQHKKVPTFSESKPKPNLVNSLMKYIKPGISKTADSEDAGAEIIPKSTDSIEGNMKVEESDSEDCVILD